MPDVFEIVTEKIVAGGDALGRRDGQVIFVPGAAAGERLRVEAVERRPDYLRGRIVEVLESSPDRREPPCPYYASCGGCALMHLDPEAQGRAKQEVLRESLERAGRFAFRGPIELRSGPEMGYRLRSRFHVKRTARGVVVGFRERGSHRVVDVDRCLQVGDETHRVLARLRAWLGGRKNRAAGLEAFEILEPFPPGGRPLLHFIVAKGRSFSSAEIDRLARESEVAGIAVSEEDSQEAAWRYGSGATALEHRVAGFHFRTRIGSFFQVNRFLLEALVQEVVPENGGRWDRAIDLYCGVGLFALPLARKARAVTGVESSRVAVGDARSNARRAGLGNVRFFCEDAAVYAARGDLSGADLVVADPPRSGLPREIVEAVLGARPAELRYVSCDPASFGRDAGRLVEGGYELARLVLFDFFPNTHHFEAVGVFRTSNR